MSTQPGRDYWNGKQFIGAILGWPQSPAKLGKLQVFTVQRTCTMSLGKMTVSI